VLGMEQRSSDAVLTGEAPLAELCGYANAVRSLGHGRASHAMTPERFEPAPASATAGLMKHAA
jgi:elongation factor G